ncbi:hypothetical protein [Longimicrobium sp.]|uniref:hypothetical protein n=1 Tax=Longimicrobium sp. TaxID=2029185 RepID=UPI002E3262F7|nr:hypothetical protein [Longimicrobium sp.]HEX6042639.1 hypothetical protein [Longimicrobium sp.]
MDQDYVTRLEQLAEELHREAGRLEIQGRALTAAEIRRVQALRRAQDFVREAAFVLASAEDARDQESGVTRGDDDPIVHGRIRDGSSSLSGDADRGGPLENTSLAGDDDTPGYGRGKRGEL